MHTRRPASAARPSPTTHEPAAHRLRRYVKAPRALALATLVITVAFLTGCGAAQDASRTTARERIESGQIVQADELRVAEYLSYYEQNFPEPLEGQVGLDLRLGNPQVPVEGGPAWLQIGLQARSEAPEDIAPLNLSLVMDTSGSMADADKLPYLQEGLRRFLQSLAPNDRVSLVVYADEAFVIQPSREVEDGRWIEAAVSRLSAGGSTNLHAGLVTGLELVDDQFDQRRNNLVILLTDGIANVGVTEPDAIAETAADYSQRGIRVAAIGLGNEFNDRLLSTLARESGGSYHFIDRPEELDRVFREAATSLLQEVASDVIVSLEPAPGVDVESVTGLDHVPAGPVSLRLQDMGSGDSQLVLVKLLVGPSDAGLRPIADVTLQYRDEIAARGASVTQDIAADAGRMVRYDPLWDTEVLRNVTIQRSAESLREIQRLYDQGQYREAWETAHQAEIELRSVADITGEREMLEDAELMRTYQETLDDWLEGTDHLDRSPYSRDQGRTLQRGYPSMQRGRLPTPTGPVLDVR